MYKNIFFDLDGTLTDSKEGIVNSFKHTLEYFELDPNIDNLNQIIGPPMITSLEKFGVPKERILEASEVYKARFEKHGIIEENKLFEGIYDMVKELHDEGRHLCLVTYKPINYAQTIMDHFGLKKYFKGVFGSDSAEKHIDKVHILRMGVSHLKADLHECVMIGDRMFDLEAAEQAGVDGVGVLYGYGDIEELSKYKNVYLPRTVLELKQFLKER